MDEKVIIEFAKWLTGHDEETIIQMYDDWASSPARQAIQVQAKVKPACGKCIDCKFYIDMDYQKDIQNACSNGNIVFGYIPMDADKFGCIYFESKSV